MRLLLILLTLSLSASEQVFVGNSSSNTVSVIDTATNTVTATISLQGNTQPQSLTFSPDGSWVFVCCKGGNSVVVLNANTLSYATTIPIQGSFPYFTAFTPDGSKAYVTCASSHSVSVIDVSTLTVSEVITTNIGTLPFFPVSTLDGKQIYVTNGGSANVSVINVATNTAQLISVASTCEYATLSLDGTKLYVALDPPANSIAVIDTATNEVVDTISTSGKQPTMLVISADGNTGYVSNYGSANISVLDLKSNTFSELISTNIGTQPNIGTISPDGSQVYFTNTGSNNVSVIDTSTNTANLITSGTIAKPYWIVAAPESSNVYLTNFKAGTTNVTQIDTQTNTGSSITVGTSPYFLAVTPVPICKNVTAITKKNRFLTQTDVINIVSWSSAGFNPTKYDIYRDIALTEWIGSVSSNGPLTFYDHNRGVGQSYSYYIVSENQTGFGKTRVGNVTVTSQ